MYSDVDFGNQILDLEVNSQDLKYSCLVKNNEFSPRRLNFVKNKKPGVSVWSSWYAKYTEIVKGSTVNASLPAYGNEYKHINSKTLNFSSNGF